MKTKWYENSIGYEIFIRSFKDANGDSIGDIAGVKEKIYYLKELGIDFIWFTPIYQSPLKDLGYDVADFKSIHQDYGTIEEFDELIVLASSLDIKIMMDLVPNHVSNEHNWFKNALSGQEKYINYFIWTNQPNLETKAFYGSSTWTYVKELDSYYYHTFSPYQPDLNWENPNVRQEFIDIANYWIKKGVKGFRIDALKNIGKNIHDGYCTLNSEKLNNYLSEWAMKAFDKFDDIYTLTEGWGSENAIECLSYINHLTGVLPFEHIIHDWDKTWTIYKPKKFDLVKLKKIINSWQQTFPNRALTNFFGNHDIGRTISRWGNDKKFWRESSTTLAIVQFLLIGTSFIYQGDEIGMTSLYSEYLSDYQDIQAQLHYRDMVLKTNIIDKNQFLDYLKIYGRDNAKTPMQWDDSNYAGFSKIYPWSRVNKNYPKINVYNQIDDINSIFNTYKWLINFRKSNHSLFTKGKTYFLDLENKNNFNFKLKYQDDEYIIVTNWSNKKININKDLIKNSTLVKNNYQLYLKYILKPWESRIYKKRN